MNGSKRTRWVVFAGLLGLVLLTTGCGDESATSNSGQGGTASQGGTANQDGAAGSAGEGAGGGYPLGVNGRHLVDTSGAPFFLHGDTAWFLMTNTTKAEAEEYLENRRLKGFNAIIVELIVNKTFTDNPPYNKAGDAPFTTTGDFATPNEAYFAHADWLIAKAAEKGILLLLSPAYVGNGAGSDGWWDEIVANGPTACRDYGRYLGNRYKTHSNIVWVHGGDYSPPPGSEGVTNALEILHGIEDTDPGKLHTFHQERYTTAFEEPTFGPYLDLDATYSGDLSYPEALTAYNRESFAPHFLYEGRYEGTQSWDETFNAPELVRAGAYWSVLSGSTGHVFGVNALWSYGWDGEDWVAAMDLVGSHDMVRLKGVFQHRAWYQLVPDQDHTTVTSGYGSFGDYDYVTAARTADGTLVMAYVPSTGTETRTLTVDMARLSGASSANWFNPTTGDLAPIAGSPLANSGSHSFTTPGDNGTGTNDWLLILETQGS